jgi:bifunctional enzyme CysN/CysC
MTTDREPASPGGVIWITGYSGAGKTTVARKVQRLLRTRAMTPIILDGDDLRGILGRKSNYGREERIELSHMYFRLCSHLASQGHTVIIAAVAMYDEVREWVKTHIPRTLEVYLRVPEDERRRRDRETKRVYERMGNTEGMYDSPESADLAVDNFGETAPDDAARVIVGRYLSLQVDRSIDFGRTAHWRSFYTNGGAPCEPTRFAHAVAERLEPERRLLEVGCGNGRDSVFFAAKGHQVTALDRSPEAIASCTAVHGDGSVQFVARPLPAVADRLPSPFDVVYSRFALHVMTRSEETETLASAARVLRPGGQLFVECRSINDPLAREGEVISPTERIYGHYRRFIVADELVAAVGAAGLTVVECVESKGLAPFGDEDPVIIRLVARKDPAPEASVS